MPKSVTNNLNDPTKQNIVYYYRVFHGFGQAKFTYGLRLEPIFNTVPAVSKNNAWFKSGQNWPKK